MPAKPIEQDFASRILLDANHSVYTPTAENLEHISSSQSDILIGHSLGAFLLLQRPDILNKATKCILVAPFLDFKVEAKKGGKIATTQLKYLSKWLNKNPLAAINDFYQRAGLELEKPTTLPYPLDDLRWGIDCLITSSTDSPDLENVLLFVGEDDPLLDASTLKQYLPSIQTIPNANHKLQCFAEIIAANAL